MASAEQLAKDGNVRGALLELRKVIESDPEHAPKAHLALGVLFGQRGKLDVAADHFRRAIQLDPHDPKAYINLGVVFAQKGQYERAIDCWKDALRIDPTLSLARGNLIKTYVIVSDVKSARAQIRLARRSGCRVDKDALRLVEKMENEGSRKRNNTGSGEGTE